MPTSQSDKECRNINCRFIVFRTLVSSVPPFELLLQTRSSQQDRPLNPPYFGIALTHPPSAKSIEVKQWERISENLKKDGWNVRHVEAMHDAETVWTAIATRGDVRHSTHANDITLAFQELEECCRKESPLTRQSDTAV